MTLPAAPAKLLEGRRGLIVGIANDRSIAWGCARAFRALGAELAVTYLNDKAKPHVEPLAREVEAAGASVLNLGIGWHEARVPTIVTSVPRAAFASYAARLKS